MKLGKREIDGLTCPPEQRDCLVFDDELKGFCVRVTRAGAKIFQFQYRMGLLTHRVRIGRYGQVTPAAARKRAEELRGEVAAGGHPAATRQAAIRAEAAERAVKRVQAESDAMTLRKLIEEWETRQLADRSPRYRGEAVRALRVNLAELLHRPAAGITVADLRAVLDAIPKIMTPVPSPKHAKTGHPPASKEPSDTTGKAGEGAPVVKGQTMARRARAYGSALYAWALGRGLVTANPFAALPVETREVSRDRFLTDGEIGEVWHAAGALGWPWGPYFRFLMLTMQREAETAGLRRDELSADGATWSLPRSRTKNRMAHIVHLAPAARAIIAAAPRIAGSDLVFTTDITNGLRPIQGFSNAKERLDAQIMKTRAEAAAEAGDGRAVPPLVAWRLHDFRRTGVTTLARLGVRVEVADRLLNHVSGKLRGVAGIYQRHDFLAERADALTRWAEHVLAVARVETTASVPEALPSNVVRLRPRA